MPLAEEKNIPVVTFNSDIVGTRRACFVGMDNRKSGRTAAGLLGMMTRGSGKILIITGYFSNHVDNQRVDGFVEEAKKAFPHLEIAGVHGSFDEASEVEHIIENAMMSTSGISGILVVSGGQAGVGKAFDKLRLDRRPYVVIYDQTPKNEKALKNDSVDFLIDQNGYVQGYEPPRILADILTKGQEPEREFLLQISRSKPNIIYDRAIWRKITRKNKKSLQKPAGFFAWKGPALLCAMGNAIGNICSKYKRKF